MSHHNFDSTEELRDIRGRLRSEMERLGTRLGATGEFPEGKLCPQDEGEIRFAVAADPLSRKILVDFGKPVHSLGLTTEQADGLIDLLQEKVMALRGIS
jgi:hypothetical protein